jgi:hypothetical protein
MTVAELKKRLADLPAQADGYTVYGEADSTVIDEVELHDDEKEVLLF